MNEQELQTTLKDLQDVIVSMDDRFQQMEKHQSETKDYSAELAHINEKLERIIADDTLNGLKDAFRNQATISSKLVTAVAEQQERTEKMIMELPQKIKVNVEHRITGQQRPYIITGIVLLLVLAISLFASIQLWRSNSALHDSDIKIRMLRVFYPQVSLDIDSIYNESPKELEKWVKQEEEKLIAIRKAEESAKQSEKQAERAKQELERLREQKVKNLE